MRVGFDAKRYYRNSTGLGNYSRNLIDALKHYYPTNNYTLYDAKRISIWRTLGQSLDINRDKLDIYHGLSNELPLFIKGTKAKSIVTIHDMIYKRYPYQYKAIDRWIYDQKVAYACKVADMIIAISEQTKLDIIEYYKVDENKIKVQYQNCNPIFQQQATNTMLQSTKVKYGLPNDFILYVGSITERKNVLTLIKAFALLNNPPAQLVIVGNGNQEQMLKNYVKESQLATSVVFLSNVATNDLPAIYQQAKLFAYPSLFEGFGIPIIEALWSKTPVITTAGGCFTEAGGPASIYVDTRNANAIAEAIDAVINHKIDVKQMVADGYNYVQQFSPGRVSKNMINLYEQLL